MLLFVTILMDAMYAVMPYSLRQCIDWTVQQDCDDHNHTASDSLDLA